MILSAPDAGYLKGGIAIATVPVLVVIHYLLSRSEKISRWLGKRFGKDRASVRKVLLNRLLGVFLFGFVPALLVLALYRQPLRDFGLDTNEIRRIIPLWLTVSIFIFTLVYFTARREENLAVYPHIRSGVWGSGLLLLSAISWMVYLAGYEFMFRGFLLSASVEAFGFWPAIAVNVIYYAFAHLPRGYMETFGAVPVGFIFCYVSLLSGSLWFALLTHITMALTNEWFSLYYNPRMHVSFFNRSVK